jgi:hypothetical protein
MDSGASLGISQSCLTVGATGHREDRLNDEHLAELTAHVQQVFLRLDNLRIDSLDGQCVQIVTSLAEGADRIFAKEALRANLKLICVLPLARSDFLDDFSDAGSREEFKMLVERASHVVYSNGEPAASRQSAYESASNYIVLRSDVLVSIWNGQPGRGKGGTADSIDQARRRGIPVVWISTTPPHEIVVLEPDSEMALSAHATLTPQTIREALSPDHDPLG